MLNLRQLIQDISESEETFNRFVQNLGTILIKIFVAGVTLGCLLGVSGTIILLHILPL